MQQIIIEGQKYQIVDLIEKITIADSYVVRGNKIGSGNGEAKLYVGQDNQQTRAFFGNRPFEIPCFLLKKDLLKYLEDTRTEYIHPEQPYQNPTKLPVLWNERFNEVSKQSEVIRFQASEQHQISGPRVYIKSDDDNYQYLRSLSIPNITYISILKLRNIANGETAFYFRLFADYFGETEHPAKIIEAESELLINNLPLEENLQITKSRKGHGLYRKKLLEMCPFCPFTMITDDRLLIASHIKPWVDSNNFEKTDPYNGFMLSPTFDFLFDKGFMSFTDDKRTILSPFLSKMTYSKIGISDNKLFNMLPVEGREDYLTYHRQNILKTAGE